MRRKILLAVLLVVCAIVLPVSVYANNDVTHSSNDRSYIYEVLVEMGIDLDSVIFINYGEEIDIEHILGHDSSDFDRSPNLRSDIFGFSNFSVNHRWVDPWSIDIRLRSFNLMTPILIELDTRLINADRGPLTARPLNRVVRLDQFLREQNVPFVSSSFEVTSVIVTITSMPQSPGFVTESNTVVINRR